MTESMKHYYVYSFRDGRYHYERTYGTSQSAKKWVAKLGQHAVYLINHTIPRAFY
jgi:hypothetical protein